MVDSLSIEPFRKAGTSPKPLGIAQASPKTKVVLSQFLLSASFYFLHVFRGEHPLQFDEAVVQIHGNVDLLVLLTSSDATFCVLR